MDKEAKLIFYQVTGTSKIFCIFQCSVLIIEKKSTLRL
jgi:hypothetical protein